MDGRLINIATVLKPVKEVLRGQDGPIRLLRDGILAGGGLILAAMIAKAHVQGEPVDVGDNEPTKEGLLAKSLFTKQWLPRVQSQIQ